MSLCLNCRHEAKVNGINKQLMEQIPKGESCSRCGYSPDGLCSIDDVRAWVTKKILEERKKNEY